MRLLLRDLRVDIFQLSPEIALKSKTHVILHECLYDMVDDTHLVTRTQQNRHVPADIAHPSAFKF